ncbi:MAG TPA: three-Cys-motif partner protein TcmP [Sedimentisphaerales bacterium]|nr:three-Cys-motif partner protein TcmP [Sedimentisphaerales bacterium]
MSEIPTPTDDGLHIPTVGEWSRDKHYFLMRYIDAFTASMKEKKWSGLHYIDLFAGAGIERLETSKDLDWGSPLIAAYARHPFDGLHLCEKNSRKYTALNSRIGKIKPDAQVLHGDGNEKIKEIVEKIPQKTLSLAFLDPYGLHLDFATLKLLSQPRADLIIFFPDHLDALRNWGTNYLHDPNSNLDRYLGPACDWRSPISNAPANHHAEVFRELYVTQIKSLGYTHFEYQRIYAKGHPLYILILCSRSALAAKLWKGISQIAPDGQRTFKFEP